MTTIDQMILQNPWMAEFKDRMGEKCHDCGAKLEEKHLGGCDTARCLVCGGQRMVCECGDEGDGDIWTGLMYPKLHKICLERNLWQYDEITYAGVTIPVDKNSWMSNMIWVMSFSPLAKIDASYADKNHIRIIRTLHDDFLCREEVYPIEGEAMRRFCELLVVNPTLPLNVRNNIPCDKDSFGAYAALNRASDFLDSEN